MTCAHHACVRPAYLHGVRTVHLTDALAAGHRATQHTPQRRLTALLNERYNR